MKFKSKKADKLKGRAILIQQRSQIKIMEKKIKIYPRKKIFYQFKK